MTKKRYLFIPSRPTPNGPLHLGHIVGPYLTADILARNLNRNGHDAKIITGSDVYDNYVTLKAYQDNTSPLAIANLYHDMIQQDLQAMKISIQNYVNVLAPAYDQQFRATVLNILKLLSQKNLTLKLPEKILYALQNNLPLLGGWILGECPDCSAAVGGFFCEKCGTHFRPEQIKHARPRYADWQFNEKTIDCYYLKIKNINGILSYLDQVRIHPFLIEKIRYSLNKSDGNFRLTYPSNWGVQYHNEQMVFPAASILAYASLFGELYQNQDNYPRNPFSQDSEVTTIATFGIDAAIPYLAGSVAVAQALPEFKTFDHFIINNFYTLENEKFSTSRKHAIWVKDIVKAMNNNVDAVRYYLAKADLKSEQDNFSINEFIKTINTEFSVIINAVIMTIKALKNIRAHHSCQDMMKNVDNFLIKQNQYLTFDYYQPHQAVKLIYDWTTIHCHITNDDEMYWWLKGFCLLAYPILPDIATNIWQYLGHEAQPTLEFFTSTPILQFDQDIIINQIYINHGVLEQCLPSTITTPLT